MENTLPFIEYIFQLPRGNIDLIEIDDEVLSYCDNISHIVMIIPDTLQVTDPHY
jgi:retron-type reverse transcriptase